MARVRVVAGEVEITATLNDSDTASRLLEILPAESSANLWGDEVYFSVPLEAPEEDPQADVPAGTVAYWPPGRAVCLFFGQKPYSPVNVIGKLDGDPNEFAKVESGDTVRLESAD